MVHDRGRIIIEAEARQLEAEAEKISAETRRIEAETARMAAVASQGGKETHVESHLEDHAVHQSGEGDWFRLTAVGADGRCSPMPTGLSPPEEHLGHVAGAKVRGIRHMRCNLDGQWSEGPVEGHGNIQLSVSLCVGAYGILDPPRVPTRSGKLVVSVLADTGAQMCVAGIRVALQLGLKSKDLVPCELKINSANNSGLDVLGAMFVTLEWGGWSSNQMVYVARGVQDFFMSKEACRDLSIVGINFPKVGSARELGSRRIGSSSALPPPTSLYGLGTKGEPQWGSGKSFHNVGSTCANSDLCPMDADVGDAGDGAEDSAGGAIAVVRTGGST